MQQESKALTSSTDQRENTIKKNAREKRKGGSSTTDEQSPAKRQKPTAQNQKKGYEKDKDQAQNLTGVNDAEEVKAKVEKTDITHEKQMKDSNTGRTKVYKDQCTAFISNLNLKASK